MLSVILLTVAHSDCHVFNVMLAVLMLSVVMPSVVAPLLMADFCVIFDNQEIMLQNFCSYLFEQKSVKIILGLVKYLLWRPFRCSPQVDCQTLDKLG